MSAAQIIIVQVAVLNVSEACFDAQDEQVLYCKYQCQLRK
jgi:hypothetical protein